MFYYCCLLKISPALHTGNEICFTFKLFSLIVLETERYLRYCISYLGEGHIFFRELNDIVIYKIEIIFDFSAVFKKCLNMKKRKEKKPEIITFFNREISEIIAKFDVIICKSMIKSGMNRFVLLI